MAARRIARSRVAGRHSVVWLVDLDLGNHEVYEAHREQILLARHVGRLQATSPPRRRLRRELAHRARLEALLVG